MTSQVENSQVENSRTDTHGEASARSGFAGNRLLRNEAMRTDEALAAALADSRTQVLVFAGGQVFTGRQVFAAEGTPVRHGIAALGTLDAVAGPILLGYEDDVAVVAARGDERLGTDGKPEGLDMRGLVFAPPEGVTAADVGALAQASSLLAWHISHRFCGRCGTEDEGRRRRLASRLPGVRNSRLPAYRPGGHHAGDASGAGGHPRPGRPPAALPARQLFLPRGLPGARRDDRDGRAARGSPRRPGSRSAPCAITRRNPGRCRIP